MTDRRMQLNGPAGQLLPARLWTGEGAPHAAICIVHGLGEHADRYAGVAQRLVEAGLEVLAYDQCGHGRTTGPRGHVPHYARLLDDLDVALQFLALRHNAVFLYGHSLGGNIVLNYCLRRQPKLAGAVVTSPLLRPALHISRPKWLLGQMLSRIWPTAAFAARLRPDQRSSDPSIEALVQTDPLMHHYVSARLAVEMLAAGQWALHHGVQMPVPLLLLHGAEDTVTCSEATREFAAACPLRCDCTIWPRLKHELHWEFNRVEVLNHIVAWMLEIVSTQGDPLRGETVRASRPGTKVPGEGR